MVETCSRDRRSCIDVMENGESIDVFLIDTRVRETSVPPFQVNHTVVIVDC
jgi:hypothetical protein